MICNESFLKFKGTLLVVVFPSDQVINGILTVCVSVQRKYEALRPCIGLASLTCTMRPLALYFSVQIRKQSVSRYCSFQETDVNIYIALFKHFIDICQKRNGAIIYTVKV